LSNEMEQTSKRNDRHLIYSTQNQQTSSVSYGESGSFLTTDASLPGSSGSR
jgi:hypothetical protein